MRMRWDQLDWYVARSSGLVAWALVTVSVLYGTLHASRAAVRPRPAWVADLHRNLATMACVFTLIHLGALVVDDYLYFGLRELAVPYASVYRPQAVAFGVVALYGMIAVQITSLVKSRITRALWHGIHLLSYAVFAFTTLHMMEAGTDRRSQLIRAIAALGITAVPLAAVARVVSRHRVNARVARRRQLVARHVPLDAPTLHEVESAILEVVNGTTRDGAVAPESRPVRTVRSDGQRGVD